MLSLIVLGIVSGFVCEIDMLLRQIFNKHMHLAAYVILNLMYMVGCIAMIFNPSIYVLLIGAVLIVAGTINSFVDKNNKVYKIADAIGSLILMGICLAILF